MENFNSIGIDGRLDWARVKKLLTIGFIASLMVFAGDFILGYGTADESLDGMEMLLSAYHRSSVLWALPSLRSAISEFTGSWRKGRPNAHIFTVREFSDI